MAHRSPGWWTSPVGEKLPLGRAAQAVQRSAFPDLYAGQEDEAREIAKEAGIKLDRAGTGGDPDGDASGMASCYAQAQARGHGGAFHDGAAGWPAVVTDPRSTAEAIAWAEGQAAAGTSGWYRSCLRFVAQSYGWHSSGVQFAIDAYTSMPAGMRHDLDREPPPGALMFWRTGGRAGHVALYLGDGLIASNDIGSPGYISVVPATEIESKWGATYVGWSPPYFPKGA